MTNVYRATRSLFLAQRFARHASPITTIIYTYPNDEELAEGVKDLRFWLTHLSPDIRMTSVMGCT